MNKIKINTFTCFAHCGGVALPTTLMALPTYHTWQSVLSYYFVQVVNLTERPTRRNYTFISSIGGAPSRPGIVRTRKRVESGEMCEIKQIIYTLVEI
jgi:hypothetical protein